MEWKFPNGVRGWLTTAEGRKLAELAFDKNVLEIGSYEGRSTICMAQTASHVTCIDPFDGRGTPMPEDTADAFVRNLRNCGVRDKVTIHVGTTAQVAPELVSGYDLIFIDGDHSRKALDIDIREALRLLSADGLLVFHDYKSARDPAVTKAVDDLLIAGSELVMCYDSLAVVRPGTRTPPKKPLVALGMPRRGAMNSHEAAQGYFFWPTIGGCEVVRIGTTSTILDHAFNRMWTVALNLRSRGITHFAMIHDDVGPCQGWLDILLTEMSRLKADVISAVVPIKSEHGLTSTAVETDCPWQPRRLTMHEVFGLPETFTDEDAGGELLLNTGLWVCDLRKPWVDDPSPLCFQTLNRIVPDEDGDLQAQVRSEDWEFSRAARARGARLAATRKVSLTHTGEMDWPNDRAWGIWTTDQIHQQRTKAGELCDSVS